MYEQPIGNILLNGELKEKFSLKLATRQGCSFSSLPLTLVLGILARPIRLEEKNEMKKKDRRKLIYPAYR